MTWQEFVKSMMVPEIVSGAVGVIESYLVEWWPKYQKLVARSKRLVFLGISVVLPVGFAVVGAAFGYYDWTWVNTFWPAVRCGVIAFAAGTVAHARKLPAEEPVPEKPF